MGPLLHEQHLPAQELIALIRSLADQVVQSRLDDTDPDTLQAEAVLAQSAPVFASLYGLTRATQLDAKESRARTQDARLEMDAAHLRLQRNHIEREIRAAEEYSSEYQSLPLLDLDQLRHLAASAQPPAGLEVPLPEGDSDEAAHRLMLARLAFELAERKRFEEERKELGAVKAKLVKENEVKKARLEELEQQLTDFVNKAKGIQAKMQDEPTAA
ncbi:hypothetical protein C6P46_000162 [Rhodotorula mucilaginosa]|uniref:Fms-interacting protein-domain-containing protein n=1 Tax=Rhodotorula mucilaginosa TaxID=5537 RepID=A0A9P6W8I9_RHOMI|nr:hypothetical protein C6P46_000162 [Rhodotorula mucilaginosa]